MSTLSTRATLDSTQFQAGLKGMQGQVQNLGQSLKSLPGIGSALSIAGLTMLAKKALESADEIDNLSRTLGISVEAVQVYTHMLDEAGLEMGTLQSATDRLTKAQSDALAGNEKARRSFDALGISQDKLKNANTEKVLEMVGQAMGQMEGDAGAASATFDLLGRNANRLRDVLIDANRDGIQAMIDEFREMGMMVDGELIGILDNAQLRLERLGKQAGTTATIGFAKLVREVDIASRGVGHLYNEMSKLEKLMLIIQPGNALGTMAGRAIAGGSGLREQLEAEADAPIEDMQASRAEREEKARANRIAGVEADAGRRLQVLRERYELSKLTSGELRDQLTTLLESAKAEKAAAQSNVEKEQALSRIVDLESRLSRIRDEAPDREERGQSQDFSALRRIGANMQGNMAPPPEMTQQTGLMRRQLAAQEKGWRVLESIENKMNGGAIL